MEVQKRTVVLIQLHELCAQINERLAHIENLLKDWITSAPELD